MRRHMKLTISHLFVLFFISFFLHFIFPPIGVADDATVLPQGVWRFQFDGQFSLPITKRFNKNGDKESLAEDFNVNINSGIFSDLSLVEMGFALTPGTGTLGRSHVKFERQINILNFQPAYGVTDRLSVGLIIPYWFQSLDVDASINTSNATLGINSLVPGGIAPLGFGGTRPANVDDIQSLLGQQGFDPIDDWDDEGFGDIVLGARYQYYKSDSWLLAFTGGVLFPTGGFDDPDNLVDNVPGNGYYALLFRFNQSWLGPNSGQNSQFAVPEAGSVLLHTTFSYDLNLPDTHRYRVCNVNAPICSAKDNHVDRDPGDIIQAEVTGSIGLFSGLYLTPQYQFGYKFKDHHTGNKDLDYGTLGDQTDFQDHWFKVGLNYSTFHLFREKVFPLPLIGTVFYQERFLGNNNQYVSRYLGFVLRVYIQ
ncbi:MAG: hypothetical protein OEW87_13695 [Flavobacteriaceae bacterium]|nr:hypothetical protein [Flavobacteriaceae bacterium]